MPDELVLARSKRTNRVGPMSRSLAEKSGAEILDGSPFRADGSLRPVTTKTGRAIKPRTTVADSATAKAVSVSADDTKENDR